MKTLEYNSRFGLVNGLLNLWPFCLDRARMRSLVAKSYARAEPEGLTWRDEGDQSLFYNGKLFFRITWPLGVWVHVKPGQVYRYQAGFGWKLNGRVGLTLRRQTDESAAHGVSGPNYGQASGWERGTA